MAVTWLHVSDFHLRAGDHYDADVVLKALVRSVGDFRQRGRAPDLIFATGDIAYSGRSLEYDRATPFFDALLEAAGLKGKRERLFVIPGNHDVDRDPGVGLARTLESREDADQYFNPAAPMYHLQSKLGAFRHWHDTYFKGIRTLPANSTCGPVQAVEVGGIKLSVLPINSALFCQDDNDHEKLWIGRRCLDPAADELKALGARVNVALVHHPLEWFNGLERANLKSKLHGGTDFILRGHLHETEVETVATTTGEVIYIAAGAAYQTRKWPNRATYVRLEDNRLTVFPIRYEDSPQEVWTVDPSVSPSEPDYERTFPIPRSSPKIPIPSSPPVEIPSAKVSLPRFRSNIPSRRNLPFVGRDHLLESIRSTLGDPSAETVLVLHGPPGAGKSELAREFARREKDRYPGGAFFIDAGAGAPPVDLARIGHNHLNLDFAPGLTIQDQCLHALLSLGDARALLIYDNVWSADVIQPWLPSSGMAVHVLITTVVENWDPSWLCLEVPPLSPQVSKELVERITGPEIAARYAQQLADVAGGLPAQICPAAATLAYEARRGRLDAVQITLTREADQSFRGVYERLESQTRLVLHAAAFLNCRRIRKESLCRFMQEAGGWSEAEFERQLDVCFDLHLLQGAAELRMHQLLASFLLSTPPAPSITSALDRIRSAQRQRFLELGRNLAARPTSAEMAAELLMFPVAPRAWDDAGIGIAIEDGETLGTALYETGRFDDALAWFERAVAAAEQGDVHGRVNHESLGVSLYQVGYCLSSVGQYAEARPWFERAVAAKEQGDVHGRVDPDSLALSIRERDEVSLKIDK